MSTEMQMISAQALKSGSGQRVGTRQGLHTLPKLDPTGTVVARKVKDRTVKNLCLAQRWPWRAAQAGHASARSSRPRNSPRRWSHRLCRRGRVMQDKQVYHCLMCVRFSAQCTGGPLELFLCVSASHGRCAGSSLTCHCRLLCLPPEA